MPTIPLNLGTGSDSGQTSQFSGVRHVNCYVESLGPDAKYPFAIFAKPGLTRWDSGSYTGVCRGIIEIDANTLAAFLGNQVVDFDQDGSDTLQDSLAGSGRIFLARNQKATPQICIVTSDKQTFLYESGTITQVTDADLPPPNSVTFLDGYFIWSIEDGRFFISSLNEGSTIDAADYATAESDSDGLVRVFAHNGFLYVMGVRSLEIWQNTGNSTFPFEPMQSDIDVGCMAGHSVAEVDNALVWVDHNGIVRMMRGTTPARISNHTIETLIDQLTDSEKADLEGFKYWHRGHEVYCLNSANWTYEFDATTGKWHESKSYGYVNWIATGREFFVGKHIVGDRTNGNLYYIDPDAYSENGAHLVMDIYTPNQHAFPGRARVSKLSVDTIRGKGLNSGTDHNDNPQIMVSFSDDGGNTYSTERRRSIGTQGDYDAIVSLNRLGQIKPQGRIWKLSISAAVQRGIGAAFVDVT